MRTRSSGRPFILHGAARGLVVGAALLLMGALSVSSFLVSALGLTYYVDDNTCPAVGAGTFGSPFCSIQKGICTAGAGDTVSVAEGTYLESLRMKPGVEVIAPAGAALTTINADNRPCVNGDFCTLGTQAQCSAVIFSTGHTYTSLLQGFTIRGGEGLVQSNKVVGGGVAIFSSPRLLDNIITNNVLSGPGSQGRNLRGAGVYVAIGTPLISNNTISNNTAIPPDGTTGLYTAAYGGGLWLNFGTAPALISNVISNNTVGSPALGFSLNTGGGIVVFAGTDPNFVTEIWQNLIADNYAADVGGGITSYGFPSSVAEVEITNNVLVGNRAELGGGVYTYKGRTWLVNNTVQNNEAFFGGGVYAGFRDVKSPLTISNNIIHGNQISMFGGSGGGIYGVVSSYLSITFNDITANEISQCDGVLSNANCVGVNGNINLDPMFANTAGRNFMIMPASPAIDRADPNRAPDFDIDDFDRGVDGDGTVNAPVAGDVDMGAYESIALCLTKNETCNGLDDNCNHIADDGFPNFDGDAQADCVDTDDDNDTILDVSDCAPLDAAASGMPQDVTGLGVTLPLTHLSFNTQNIGSSVRYDVLSGVMGQVRTLGFAEMYCLAGGLTTGSYNDSLPAPPPGRIRYYLIRAKNNCADGTLGTSGRDAPGDVCQNAIVDLDNDGSPSNLDCDDSNPGRSHLLEEVCDNIDNNCSGGVDNVGTISCGVGACQRVVQSCVAGVPQSCTPGSPSAEVCDGLDNNCNGAADENIGVGGPCEGLGICGAGLIVCYQGMGICSTEPGGPQNQSSPETCDSLDNDCDGAVDDNLGQTSCGQGVCQRTVNNCVAGVTQTCTPGQSSAETCDGLDNDCNGTVDNGFSVGQVCDGVGSCGLGVFECNGSGGSRCSTNPGGSQNQAVPETCDFNDNDCNGVIDNGFNLGTACDGVGECGAGVRECNPSTGGTRCSTDAGGTQGQAIVETCDAKDNDCDGVVDDGFNPGGQCDGIGECGIGTIVCTLNGGTDCSTNPGGPESGAVTEICDRKDNDCDGMIDDSFPVGLACDGIGRCGMGVTECGPGQAIICSTDAAGSQSQAGGEVCNALDDDCDGQTDEDWNLGIPCDGMGECGMGVRQCDLAGGAICSTEPEGSNSQAVPEICDGKDNNCDGLIDDGFTDSDFDGQSDCADLDDDNDGADDLVDCRPLDPSLGITPGEIPGLTVGRTIPTQIMWSSVAGSATDYEVATGLITAPGSLNFTIGQCLGTTAGVTSINDTRPAPTLGSAYYYMVKGMNACGIGGFGTPARDTHPGCP